MPSTSPVRVSASSPVSRAPPKSASLATPPRSSGWWGTSTFWGLTSRWITPRAWAWASASVEREADLEQLLVGERVGGDQLREGVAVDQLGDQVEGVLRGARLVQDDDRRVRQARAGERLAARALAVDRIPARPERDPLDRHFAVQQLVVGAPHHPEAAGAEAFEQPVAAEHQRLLRPARRRASCESRRRSAGARESEVGAAAADASRHRPDPVPGAGVDEGVERVHRLPSSPSAGPLPAPPGRKKRREREVAGFTSRVAASHTGPLR